MFNFRNRYWRAASMSLVAASMATSLTGCVVVIGPDDHEGVYWASDFDEGIHDDRSALARKVSVALSDVPALNRQHIRVAADGSTISLEGRVDSTAQLTEMVEVTRSIAGVEKVETHVTVRESVNN